MTYLGPTALRNRHRNAPRPAWKGCGKCGAPFQKRSKESWVQWEARVTCSYRCAQTIPMRERLHRFIRPAPGPLETECWLWTGALEPSGYGRLIVREDGKKRYVRAHRMMFQVSTGHAPGPLCVMHRCDTPNCIRPEHLLLGTHADNAADREAKGRGGQLRGEATAQAKLTDAVVAEIRRGGSATLLARKHGVTPSLIYKVRQGLAWSHVA